MKRLNIILFIGTLVWLTSCQYKEVQSDADSYCACKEKEYTSQSTSKECTKLLLSLKKKYEYLPEQQEILVLKIADCLAEE